MSIPDLDRFGGEVIVIASRDYGWDYQADTDWLATEYEAPFELDGVEWPTVDHYFLCAQMADPVDVRAIMEIENPWDAREYAVGKPLRDGFDELRLDVMAAALFEKFECNPPLKGRLIATGDRDIQVSSLWPNTFWGVHKPADKIRPEGQNHLGKLLMMIRQYYQRYK